MADLTGNLLVAQSGGPTAVINASLAGVVQEAGKHEGIEEIYGSRNGVLGILNEDLIDFNEEKARAIDNLKYTPGAALGTCRYKLDFKKKPEQAAKDLDRLCEVLEAHNIRYFCYIGGNDSQDTSNKIHQHAAERGYELRVIGVPKTIDNDLPNTDHSPGFGSVAKYNATTIAEIGKDVGSMASDQGMCCLVEVMGRSAGWIAAGTVLARRNPSDAPHIVLVPEIPFDQESFLSRVKAVTDTHNYCVVVVGEGIKDAQGEEIGVDKTRVDAFGHPLLSGAAENLGEIVEEKLGTKTRTAKLGYAQRAAAHFASQTDIDEAVACGQAAVRGAVEGKSGYMIKLVRGQNDPYECHTELHDLNEIANQEKLVPREWLSEDGFLPNEQFIAYAAPLIQGQPKLPLEGGLPKYVVLENYSVEKKLLVKS